MNLKTSAMLEQALAAGKEKLSRFIITQTRAACTDSGWKVKDEATDPQGTALIALNDRGQRLAIHIGGNGEISTDMSGFSGRSCERAIAEFYQALEARGVRVEKKQEAPHYLFQGGALINGVSQPQQILKNAKRHSLTTRSARKEVTHSSQQPAQNKAKKSHLLRRLLNHHG
jgi:hypothetical protein